MKFFKSLSFLLIAVVMLIPVAPVVADHESVETSQLWSFGQNSNGKTGLDTAAGETLVPTLVVASTTWTMVSAGGSHSLSIKDDGTMWSFGSNSSGATGLGTDVGDTLVPTQIGLDTDWIKVDAGASHSLSIKDDGTMWSFGSNSSGATGLGTDVGSTVSPTQVGSDTTWDVISAGDGYSLAVKTDGTLWSFGNNANGRTGLGTTTGSTTTPTQVGADTDWTYAAAGTTHSFAIKDNGTLWSFGNNANGRTALGTTTGSTITPTQVGTDTDWTYADAAPAHSVALKEGGTLWSSGSNTSGRTGLGVTVGSTLVPTQVGTDTDWTIVSAGGVHTLIIKEGGTLWSFGANSSGATGLGTTTGNALTPTQVGTDTDWLDVAAGTSHSLTLKYVLIQPTVETIGATDITETSAELSGEMLTSGNVPKDSWGFNYGTTDSYGSVLAGVTTLRNPGVFSLILEGLTCGTEYHFQAYLNTSGGDVLGDDVTFTTTPCTSSSSGGGSSGGSTSIVRQYEIYMERGEYERAEALKQRWSRFFPEAEPEVPTSTATSTEATIELIKKNIAVFEQAKALGIVLPDFIETLLKQVGQTPQVRDLELYMEGEDVLALQRLLNQNDYVVASGSENGAPGFETTYFGLRTEAALARYQAAVGIAPAAGYFGAITRNYMKNAGLVGVWW